MADYEYMISLIKNFDKIINNQTIERLGHRIPPYMIHAERYNGNVFFGYRAKDGEPIYI